MYRLSPYKYRYSIGVASDDLAVAKDNDAAALADAPIHQADTDGIKTVLHCHASGSTDAGIL